MRYDTLAAPPAPATAVIELGEYRDADPDERGAGPAATRHRSSLAVLLALVLLTVAAAAPPAPGRLRATFRVAASAADTFSVSEDTLLVAQRRATGRGLLAYDLDTGLFRWQALVAPAASYAVRRSGDTLFVGERTPGGGPPGTPVTGQTRTAALSADSGAELWGLVGRVVPVEGAGTVLAVTDVPSVFGGGRRVQGAVTGIDLRTGARLWSVPLPSTAVLQPLPGAPGRLLLVHDTGRMELRDVTDGRALAVAALPPANYAPDNPGIVGGTVLLRHPQAGGWAVSAYDAGSLARRWSRPESTVPDAVRACGPLICLAARSGVRGLDPADGTARWFQPGWRTLEQRGEHLLVYGSPSGEADLAGLADPRTGALLVDLRPWRVVSGPADADILLSRPDRADGRPVVGLAVPRTRTVRILGGLEAGAGDCRAGSDRMVCRSADGAIVGWTYR